MGKIMMRFSDGCRRNRRILLICVASAFLMLLFSCGTESNFYGRIDNSNRRRVVQKPQDAPTTPASGSAQREFTGVYNNDHFGFSVRIPDGLIGRNSPPPAPDNGFVISIGDSSIDRLSAWAEIRPFDNELGSIRDEFVAFARNEETPLMLKNELRTELNGFPAIQFEFVDSLTDATHTSLRLFAFRLCGENQTPILYVIALDSGSTNDKRSLTHFESLKHSWKMTEKCDI